MGLALSTAWNSFRYNRAKGFILEIKKLGFDCLELGFSLTPEMISDISNLVDKGEFKAVSLHNFCPIPDGLRREEALPDYYSMSSLDNNQRRQSIKYAKISIDTAQRLKAQVVILHCGRVELFDKTRGLAILLQKGSKDNKEYTALKDDILKEREKNYKPYLENTLRSLEELSKYAAAKKVILGIENRFYLREIPSFEEIGLIMDNFKDSNLMYWHDTGHAQVNENLGFNKHKDYLDNFGERMAGMHLHDCLGVRDHLAPGLGEIDFSLLSKYINKNTLKVIEAHYPASAKELKQSKNFLENIFDGKL